MKRSTNKILDTLKHGSSSNKLLAENSCSPKHGKTAVVEFLFGHCVEGLRLIGFDVRATKVISTEANPS